MHIHATALQQVIFDDFQFQFPSYEIFNHYYNLLFE